MEIDVKHISKRFGAIKALDDVSLDVAAGEVFGLLGPDGAGKTTIFRILTTLILPDAGSASVCGADVVSQWSRVRAMSGYMPGRFSLYPDLSVEENLNFFASLFGTTVKDNFDVIAPIYNQLAPFRKRRAGKLSGGMKQKLALCCALIHKPAALFLDEPTTGVDAVSRGEFWDILSEIKSSGMPVLVSTPYMDEASRCDRVALIDKGHILTTGTPADIVSRNSMPLFAVKGNDNYSTLLRLRAMPEVAEAYLFGQDIHVYTQPGVNADNLRKSLDGAEVTEVSPGIEDVFIKLMGNGQ